MLDKRRLERVENTLDRSEMRVIVLDDVKFYKEGGKYYQEATNGKERVKYEIDPHEELFNDEYEGKVVDRQGIGKNDKVIIIVGTSNFDGDEDVIYEETFNGKTRALTKNGRKRR